MGFLLIMCKRNACHEGMAAYRLMRSVQVSVTLQGDLAGQVLATDFAPAAAARVMNRLAKLSARFIGERGFSIGVDDVTPADVLQRRKRAIISQSYVQCEVRRSACSQCGCSQGLGNVPC